MSLMEKLNYSYLFKSFSDLPSVVTLQRGFFIWILHATKIPPHIGCSVNGKYFSVKVNGKDNGLSVEQVVGLIDSKNIATFFVEVFTEMNLVEVSAQFDKEPLLEPNKNSCTTPINKLFGAIESNQQVAVLLKQLELEGCIGRVFTINLPENHCGILSYTNEEINNRLEALNHVKRRKSIS